MDPIKLTEYSKGAGCGCKIAPKVLQEILQNQLAAPADNKLLVGNNTSDDAAVYIINDEQCLISTTDFFTPIVNDPFAFGQVAAANAISDVYAMGGQPILALAILGWPVEKLNTETANAVIAGARDICTKAGITLAGGHSIDSQEPIFGLSVNGLVPRNNIKQNNTAKAGDVIFITKPIGTGILTTAEKKGVLLPEDEGKAVEVMTALNTIGTMLGEQKFVTAMTDITGFGLAGHLIEICEGAGLSAGLHWNKIPWIADLNPYLKAGVRPDATSRNWNSYGSKIKIDKAVPMMDAFTLLPDPQTSGGLLVCVQEQHIAEMQKLLKENGLEKFTEPIGQLMQQGEKLLLVD